MRGGFRLVTSLDELDGGRAVAIWRPRNERPPPFLVLEALIQCAGLFLQCIDRGGAGHWFLAGVDDVELPLAAPSEAVTLECVLDHRSSDWATLTGTARAGGAAVCRGRLLLVRQRLSSNM